MHALAFRVMRLCRPDIPAEVLLSLALKQDFVPDFLALDSVSGNQDASVKGPFDDRANTEDPVEALGIKGILELPQNFGTIHLGEAFSSYISVGNYSSASVEGVVIKAELQSTRQKITLYETATPLVFAAGERHDFLIKHDIKEISAYTLICSTSYTEKGETAYQPQYFKFVAQNPLSVRTKIRSLRQQTFLEACVENLTGRPLVLAYVRLDAAPNVVAIPASSTWSEGITFSGSPSNDTESTSPETYADSLQIVDAGGSSNFLYALHSDQSKASLSGALGKLEIRWRGSLGKLGRLQTQQIMANAVDLKDVELLVTSLPHAVHLETSFAATLLVRSNVDHILENLALRIPQHSLSGGLVIEDLSSTVVPRLEGNSSTSVMCTLLPMKEGLQKLQGIELVTQQGDTVLDVVDVECFVLRR